MKKTNNGEKRKYTTITIPTTLFEKLQKQIENTSFSSVSDYATYILRETIFDSAVKREGRDSTVVEKLRAVGYKV
ncbi:MAG: CopG family transcriptional regulator [Candidatus Micrarchaeaceae archaeon]|jgi:Arc/MetJ-type ribon-helix-helix transcriptional regulator|nr:CopG family transcriptional regulator [Candidatus Micrarchaeota archaeon]HII09600.1 CopG family transcriptional regulator [Candidatus Micrarchaeota archaeon]